MAAKLSEEYGRLPDAGANDLQSAIECANKLYEKAGGPTADLRRVYGALLENERQRREQEGK